MALESLIAEHANETRTTRRLIERIPANQFEWRPHTKSFTAGGLASHIVECMAGSSPSSCTTISTSTRQRSSRIG